jgi:hypothetical protein
MRHPASCRGCAGRNRPRVQHWRGTRCCMTRCRARRTESNCQVGNRRRARLPRYGLITAPRAAQHVQPEADHTTARPHRCARPAGATASVTVCGQQINRLPPDQTSARAWPPSGGQARMSAPSIPAQTPAPRPHSQKTALPDSRLQTQRDERQQGEQSRSSSNFRPRPEAVDVPTRSNVSGPLNPTFIVRAGK